MKSLFYFNSFVFLFLGVSFVQPLIGLLLMVPIGLCQLITTIHLLINPNNYDLKWKPYLIFHLMTSLLVVITLFESQWTDHYLIMTLIALSLLLSFYFMIILYLIYMGKAKKSPSKV